MESVENRENEKKRRNWPRFVIFGVLPLVVGFITGIIVTKCLWGWFALLCETIV